MNEFLKNYKSKSKMLNKINKLALYKHILNKYNSKTTITKIKNGKIIK
jgi:hypothetical protein